MDKSRDSKGQGNSEPRLPATVSKLHPADFPIGSVESRAAARSMVRVGELRAGDRGEIEGVYYIVVKTRWDKDGGPIVVVLPRKLSELRPGADEKTRMEREQRNARVRAWLKGRMPAY